MINNLTTYQERSNQQLNDWLKHLPYQNQPLAEAMRYGLLLGGKRIRPYLVYTTGQMLGASLTHLDTPAAAIECIHAYSLIHDDLPAMDNDALRRGQPTCHIRFNEETAILAGDALQTLAFTILAEGILSPVAECNRVRLIQKLAQASGASGMCLGQALDLSAENQMITLDELETIHRHKTGALICCAIQSGAIAAGPASNEVMPLLNQFADAIGLAFQVQDDILDVISDTETLGKPQGSDDKLNKSTYPALLGLKGAQQKALLLQEEALQALIQIPYETGPLEQFARYVIERKN